MAIKMIREAILETIDAEMARDENVIMLGEDIVGGNGAPGGPEAIGGIWSTSTGLWAKYGPDRVIDTPISESAIIGAAAGASLTGKRAIAEIMFADFIGVCMDQIWNQVAKFRYMFGGKSTCPIVIRMVYGAGFNAAAQHSQSIHAMVTAMPGLKVVMPSTAADAKGLLTQAIRDDDPVIFLEHKALYAVKGEVPDGEYLIPFGHARHVMQGDDITILATGMMVGFAEAAARQLAEDGIGCDIIDLRTTSPLDEEAILDSVERTGRLLIVDESPPRCSLATDLSALVANKAFASLRAPIEMVTGPHTPIPFARELEQAYLPSPDKITAAAIKLMSYKRG
ncbi:MULTISPECIES: alpha-ketoacid dehydrogenase subunit beta [unclassified Sphingobium]|jgi:pyruvate/2-oxoglutarate/acetoin dehydrogenase E1 component|uniref:alpha-ketoacid dehydrogenase subunit beta n=1 Tax=unclassified Sphingobium TaxID=2611147 RepID=UPI001E572EDF|nr:MULTISPECIES: alpha-ketoacid dehydrogenase subunit beta [unclassified Sphingobium]GLI99841.1 pyruvate dehydrogenase subunit beta [Sphingobium sp. BS19]CAH0354817.1 Acetoin:2,6-dichlorophenolindophenol oxidoreductase subunit beta [Sphingobium sp. CECT 9361]|tara:strand:- start:10384 stop:11400 length:1017 start_codon:yes stop_codon:yes gene_type:complete